MFQSLVEEVRYCVEAVPRRRKEARKNLATRAASKPGSYGREHGMEERPSKVKHDRDPGSSYRRKIRKDSYKDQGRDPLKGSTHGTHLNFDDMSVSKFRLHRKMGSKPKLP